MPSEHSATLLTSSEIKHVLIVVLALAGTITAGARAHAGEPGDEGRREFEQLLDEMERQIESSRATLDKTLPSVEPDQLVSGKQLFELFGMEAGKEYLAKFRKALAKVEVNAHDLRGLDAYAFSQYALAAKAFRQSDTERPGREFPAWFLGAISFQTRKYAQAQRHFARAIAINKECRSAYFTRRLCELLEQNDPQGMNDYFVQFVQAHHDAINKLGLADEQRAFGAISPFAHDPVLFKAAQLTSAIVAKRRHLWEKTLERMRDSEKDPMIRLTLELLLTGNTWSAETIGQLSARYPQQKALKIITFLESYFEDVRADPWQAADTFGKDLREIRKLDPDNGALMLLEIAPRRAKRWMTSIPL